MSSSIWHKFIEEGLINEEMLAKAKQMQSQNKSGLGFNLALLGADEELLTKKLASYYGVEYIDLLSIAFDPEVLNLVTREKAESMCILPIKKSGKNVLIAVADPIHPELTSFLKELKMLKGIDAEIVMAPESYIKLAIDQVIPKEQKSRVAETLKDIAGTDVDLEIVKEQQIQEDAEAVDEAPVIKLCNSLISDAVEKMASDIHIEPFEKEIKIRYRIDGTLVEQPSPPVKYKRAIASRFKVMAKLDIIEKRKPQDGRIKIKVKDKMIDLRVSTLPVVWGEKIVMRILDQSNLQLDLTKLGFEPDDLVKFQKAINSPYGIILVTGPTGSGKTTTLYSALSTINSPDINIMTAEDPVEYNLPNINQVQINPDADLTFANALRAFLRQDPDVIMVGEIRDQETAEIAIKAALTGHLVISTLHTNDAPTTISRLLDMGIEPFYIGASVIMIVAQRLMRKVCPDCAQPISYDEGILKQMGTPQYLITNGKFLKGQGCSTCNNSGYKGRIAIYELMEINEELKKSIMHGADSTVLKEIALKNGMKTLRQSAILKMCAGLTTLDEVLSVTVG
ncbi:MAG: type IV-A pilus assembly ATPase PilB [Candidatus Goldbacteria bacterium]|nr:type IV-A pilus assembly ATPase PilB [Candidatus Goldiibacteriota bacterium]